MLKNLAKSALIKSRTKKYRKLVDEKSSAYDKWQKTLEKEKVAPAEAPVNYETSETGELVPYKLLAPKIKIVPYAKVWEILNQKDDENTVYIFVSPKGKLTHRATEVIKQYFVAHPEHNVVYGDEDETGNYSADGLAETLKPAFGFCFCVRHKNLPP